MTNRTYGDGLAVESSHPSTVTQDLDTDPGNR